MTLTKSSPPETATLIRESEVDMLERDQNRVYFSLANWGLVHTLLPSGASAHNMPGIPPYVEFGSERKAADFYLLLKKKGVQ